MDAKQSPPGSFLLAERYLEDILRNRGVFHIGFYAGTDAAAEQGGQIKILHIERGEIHLEAGFLQGAFDPLKIKKAFEQHEYQEFGRTSINRCRTIIHYKTPQGKAFIDFRPLSLEKMPLEDLLGQEHEIPEHLRIARSYLGQILETSPERREHIFSFMDVAEMYVAPNTLRLGLLNKKTTVTLKAKNSLTYDCKETLLEISEHGYHLVAHREQQDNHQAFYRLEDGSFIELQLQDAYEE